MSIRLTDFFSFFRAIKRSLKSFSTRPFCSVVCFSFQEWLLTGIFYCIHSASVSLTSCSILHTTLVLLYSCPSHFGNIPLFSYFHVECVLFGTLNHWTTSFGVLPISSSLRALSIPFKAFPDWSRLVTILVIKNGEQCVTENAMPNCNDDMKLSGLFPPSPSLVAFMPLIHKIL